MTRTLRTQVAVVGAGPAGATLANFLGMYGVDALLVERSLEIIDYPRAVGMDDECLRSFQAVDLADELIKDMIQNVPLRFFDGRNRCFADVRPATREYGWSRRNIFMQPSCEVVLRRGLHRFPRCVCCSGTRSSGWSRTATGSSSTSRLPEARPCGSAPST